MKIKDLAYALGISDSMASRLVKRGMPAHSVEAAQKWRAKNLDPSMTKQNRADGNQGGKKEWRERRGARSVAYPHAAVDDPADPLITYMREKLPARLFSPMAIAAILSDAKLPASGEKVLRLTAMLYLYYMRLIDPADEIGCVVPLGLEHGPSSPEFKAVAKVIDGIMARRNAAIEA
jgi:hypothetical protein